MKKLLIFKHEDWIKGDYLIKLLVKLAIAFQLINIDQGNAVPKTIFDEMMASACISWK